MYTAFDKTKHTGKTDHYGVSVAAVNILAHARLVLACAFLESLIASTALINVRYCCYRMRLWKGVQRHAVVFLRAILPLPAVMQILDVLLPASLEEVVSKALPAVTECYIGARPRTQ